MAFLLLYFSWQVKEKRSHLNGFCKIQNLNHLLPERHLQPVLSQRWSSYFFYKFEQPQKIKKTFKNQRVRGRETETKE